MKQHVIIVAGGKGLRFGAGLPKQFMLLKGMPVLMYSIKAFFNDCSTCNIIVCLPDEHLTLWKDLCKKHEFKIAHKLIVGGETRFQSVKNGLDAIADSEGLVAIHDGVRPLISTSLISKLFREAHPHHSAVPIIDVTDSIRKVDKIDSIQADRSQFKAVQTPQCFNLKKLKQAYQQNHNTFFTDDASVFESMGNKIHLVEGDKKNIKITTSEDLAIAEALISLS